jgi:hypothetical protein
MIAVIAAEPCVPQPHDPHAFPITNGPAIVQMVSCPGQAMQ